MAEAADVMWIWVCLTSMNRVKGMGFIDEIADESGF